MAVWSVLATGWPSAVWRTSRRTKRWPLCSHSSVTMARQPTSWPSSIGGEVLDDRLDVDPRAEADVGGQDVVGVAEDPARVRDALAPGRAAAPRGRRRGTRRACRRGSRAARGRTRCRARAPRATPAAARSSAARRASRRRRAPTTGSPSVAAPSAHSPPSSSWSSRRSPSGELTCASWPSYTGTWKRARIVPCSSQSRPQRAAGGWHRYAYTSTPGTRPPRNPSAAATSSSWILLVDAVAVLNATTEYASTVSGRASRGRR